MSQNGSQTVRFAYAVAGGLLSLGAPLGLLGVRLARTGRGSGAVSLPAAIRELSADAAGYLYVGTSTAVMFGLFGYVVGRHSDRLARLSEADPLTGLANARALFRRLDTELARSRRYREPLSLLILDVDDLKSINDRFGHRVGDEALRNIGDVIRSELRETDLGARWGGDEFAVLAPSTSKEAALALAERIRAWIPRRGVARRLSGSVGVATIDPNTDRELADAAALMRVADAAMYKAKRQGRNRVVMAAPRDSAHGDNSEARANGSHSRPVNGVGLVRGRDRRRRPAR
jgi:diguanylate cyclase (GGDEF)-like protein